MPARRCYISLGKRGDILNALPMAWLDHQAGDTPGFMVAREYADVLDGISWVHKEVWDGRFVDCNKAAQEAVVRGYGDVKLVQVYGHGAEKSRVCSSFVHEAWRAGGRLEKFGAPLIFDRRDADRETALLLKHWPDTTLPVILDQLDGESSPFPAKALLLRDLEQKFAGRAAILNISGIRAEKFYDMLAFMDKAALLVSIDTGHLHLAHASKVPVCALVADTPTLWHGVARRPQHVSWMRYREFGSKKAAMYQAISSVLSGEAPFRPTIHHAWSQPAQWDPAAKIRHDKAAASWAQEAATFGRWMDTPLHDSLFSRNGSIYGDKPLPFIADLLNAAAEKAEDRDIILFTNSDIHLTGGIGELIENATFNHGCCWAHRWDLSRIDRAYTGGELQHAAAWYPGLDLFAMTKSWWLTHRANFPDMLLAREAWDWVMKELMKQNGGVELHTAIYHEVHDSLWKKERDRNPGNRHNRGWARAWLAHNRIGLKELSRQSFEPKQWPVVAGAPQPVKVGAPPVVVKRGQAYVRHRPGFNPPALPPSMLKKGSAPKFRPGLVRPKTVTGAALIEPVAVDLLYVLGTGSKWDNNELRYSLRSAERYLTGVGRVFVVGYDPGFLSSEVTFLPFPDGRGKKEQNILAGILHAAESGISDSFLWSADDIFWASPTSAVAYPYYWDMPLTQRRDRVNAHNGYRVNLNHTYSYLLRQKKATTSFEVHVPFLFNRAELLSLQPTWEESFKDSHGFNVRSCYANMLGITGEKLPDLKFKTVNGAEDVRRHVAGRHVFSTNDAAVVNGVGAYLAEEFPGKCRWER